MSGVSYVRVHIESLSKQIAPSSVSHSLLLYPALAVYRTHTAGMARSKLLFLGVCHVDVQLLDVAQTKSTTTTTTNNTNDNDTNNRSKK